MFKHTLLYKYFGAGDTISNRSYKKSILTPGTQSMYRFIKRTFDVVVSSLFILLLLPISIIIMIILKCTGEGHVFYLQERVGYKNKRFKIWKFATMLRNSPSIGTEDITIQKDPRVLPVGAFLRKTKLNELPQLINVFIGDMSVVGPRPLMVKGFERYSPEVQMKIYNVKPGITGIGSVIFRDEESIVSKAENYEAIYQKINNFKGELEFWYQQHASFITDIKILLLTVWVVLFPKSNLASRIFPDLPSSYFINK